MGKHFYSYLLIGQPTPGSQRSGIRGSLARGLDKVTGGRVDGRMLFLPLTKTSLMCVIVLNNRVHCIFTRV